MTRAAIASLDRKSKESIADKDRSATKRLKKEELRIKDKAANYAGLKASAGAVKDLAGAAGSLGSLMHNDPEFYKAFGIDKVANLPLWHRLGLPLYKGWLFPKSTAAWTNNTRDVVPGICIIWYCPCLPNNNPTSVDEAEAFRTSPINLSLTRFQAQLLKNNSRVPNNDAADFGLYWYAIDGVLEEAYRARCALRAYNTYHAQNGYMSKAYITAYGFDVDDFIANAPQYRLALQKFISLFNTSFVVPKEFNFLKRRLWMHNVVIRDRKSPKAQTYIFRSQYNATLTPDESAVNITRRNNGYFTKFETWYSELMSKVQNLINSTGIVEMTANLRAGIKETSVMQLPEFDYDEGMAFSDDYHDLEQVHNLRTLPITSSYNNTDTNKQFPDYPTLRNTNINQSEDGYLYQGRMNAGGLEALRGELNFFINDASKDQLLCVGKDDFLSFFDDTNPSYDSVLEATRMRFKAYVTSIGGNNYLTFNTMGSEIPICMSLVVMDESGNCVFSHLGTDFLDYSTRAVFWTTLSQISTFDWHPAIRCHSISGEGTAANPVAIDFYMTNAELDNVAYLGTENLRWLHDACALSEFAVADSSYN